MDDLIKRLERVIQTGAPDKDGMHPISAEAVLEVIKQFPPAELSTNLASLGTDVPDINVGDMISRQAAIDIAKELTITIEGYEMHNQAVMNYCAEIIQLPPIQPKRGRWHYSDGKPARIGLSFGVVCDQCGTESEYCTNFCGECGADMREVTT